MNADINKTSVEALYSIAKVYYAKTGIGGYTLIENSQGLYLVSHIPVTNDKLMKGEEPLQSEICTLKTFEKRILIQETDKGKELFAQI